MYLDPDQPWYHGSPFELTMLFEGSTITQKNELARIFSHKPTVVSMSDDGQIKHNGTVRGYLYTVTERIEVDDVIPHPHTTMPPGDEWITTRELRVQLHHQTEIIPEERFTDMELSLLQEHPGE